MSASKRIGRRFAMSFVPSDTTSDGASDRPSEQAHDAEHASSGGRRLAATAPPVQDARRGRLIVDVRRRHDVAVVRPRGELDLASVESLRAALDGIRGVGRLVLDLRGLSFIDCTGLSVLVAVHKRAQRDGFQLTLVAPEAPADRALRLSGLDRALPFAAPVEAAGSESGGSASALAQGPRPAG